MSYHWSTIDIAGPRTENAQMDEQTYLELHRVALAHSDAAVHQVNCAFDNARETALEFGWAEWGVRFNDFLKRELMIRADQSASLGSLLDYIR